MINLIYAEIYKLRKGKAIKISFLVSLASSIILMILSNMLAKGNFEVKDLSSASFFGEVMMLSLLSALMISIIVCDDFETKTIHDSIASGNGRKNIVISKAIAYVLSMVFITLPYIITTIVCYCLNIKFAGGFITSTFINILADKGAITASALVEILVISLIVALIFSARMTILFPIAFKKKNLFITTCLGFAASGIIDYLVSFTKYSSFFNKVISLTPFCRKYLFLSMDTEISILIKAVIVSIIFIIIMVLITYSLFRKDEIK